MTTRLLWAAALVLSCWSRPAPAAFTASCSVSATALAFGTYTPSQGTATDALATVSIVCNPNLDLGITFTVRLSTGGSGSYAGRAMTSAGGTLQYQVYQDPARTQVWGDGSAGTATNGGSFAALPFFTLNQSYTAYGRITSRQNVGAGVFTDTLIVTVTY